MKSDSQIQQDVMDQQEWEPFLNGAEIEVAVKNGFVRLSGTVDSWCRKLAAENAAKKIRGVKAITNDIQIGFSNAGIIPDSAIAEAVAFSLKWHSGIREENITIKVVNGHVALEGEVEWEYERKFAKSAIENLLCVRSVIDLIIVRTGNTATDNQQRIRAAFHRSATIDSGKIFAEVDGSKVTLRGKVLSFTEKEDAAKVAWDAPGITMVVNKIEIEVPEHAYVD